MAGPPKSPPGARVRKLMPSLGVADLPRAVAFYRDFFGFEIVDSYDDDAGRPLWCWLRAGVGELQLNQLDEERQITLDPAIGQSWVMYLRPDDLDAVHAKLRAAGVEVSDIETTPYGARECFCKDADGYDLWLSMPESGRGPDDEDDDDVTDGEAGDADVHGADASGAPEGTTLH